jgi:hypothetical protein
LILYYFSLADHHKMSSTNNNNNGRNECHCTPASPEIIRSPITEAELLEKEIVTPEDVHRLNCITEGFLCRPEDNIYGEPKFLKIK